MVTLRINPRTIRNIANSHPRLQSLRQRLIDQHNFDQQRAGKFIERLLNTVLNDLGDDYMSQMSARIDRIVSLRDEITAIYDRVLQGDGLSENNSPASVERLMAQLESELDQLKSPSRFAREERPILRDDAVSRSLEEVSESPTRDVVDRPTFEQTILGQTEAFNRLDSESQLIVQQAILQASDLVHRAISATIPETFNRNLRQLREAMEREGMSEPDINRLLSAIREMNPLTHRHEFPNVIGNQVDVFNALDSNIQQLILNVASQHPNLLRRAIITEVGPDAPEGISPQLRALLAQLETEGMSQAQRDLVAQGVGELGLAHGRSRRALELEIRGETLNRIIAQGQVYFLQLDHITKGLITQAAQQAPNALRRAVLASVDPANSGSYRELNQLARMMEESGMSSSDLNRLRDGVSRMNRAHNQSPRNGVQSAIIESLIENNLVLDQQFFADLTAASTSFARSGLADNPAYLLQLYAEYRRGTSQASTFRSYLFGSRGRMRIHIRGMSGEFHAAFVLGGGLTLLKGPDYDVTIPGTDLVGLADLTGDVWLIDNKAFSSTELSSVNALTRNLPQNIADDVGDFQGALAGRSHVPPVIQSAVNRLSLATNAIQQLTQGMTHEQIASTAVQQKITAILNRYRIRRVVTNAGGNIQGLSEALQQQGIQLEDL